MAMAASFQASDCPETPPPQPFTKRRSLPRPVNSADTALKHSLLPALKL